MAAPVQNHQPPAQPRVPQNAPAQRAAPGGVADAPDNMESAAEGGQQEPEIGYVESGILRLGRWISWLFKKIFCCCYREEPELDNTPVPPQVRPPELIEEIRIQVDLREAVDRLTDTERTLLYRQIGRDIYRSSHMRSWLSSYEEIGRSEVERNPLIVEDYLTIPD